MCGQRCGGPLFRSFGLPFPCALGYDPTLLSFVACCWGVTVSFLCRLLGILWGPALPFMPGVPLAFRTYHYIYPPPCFARAFFFFSFDRMMKRVYATRSTRKGTRIGIRGELKRGEKGIFDVGCTYVYSLSHTQHLEVLLWEIQSSIYI